MLFYIQGAIILRLSASDVSQIVYITGALLKKVESSLIIVIVT